MAKKNFDLKKFNLDLNGLKDAVSDTIFTVADKVLDLADGVADTAKVGQQIAKLFMEKKKEETALNDAYLELGKLYYDLHKQEAEGVLADLCMEIENTLVNIEDITAEIEALKASVGEDVDAYIVVDDDGEAEEESEDFLERMAETVEDALDGLDDAIEAALEKLEVSDEVPQVDDDEIEVSVEQYLDDDDFVAPHKDEDVVVEIVELPAEEETPEQE